MKNIKNIISYAAMFCAAGFGFTSCDIDQLPLNEVVLENYWTDKNDVESVVASCYNSARSSSYIERLIVWGEDRSDNVTAGAAVSSDLKYLLQGNIKTTNVYCAWASFYDVINKCNTVLAYAPSVAEKDPNYTSSDLRVNIAECKFLRAYSYFTLAKTFKAVPFTMEPSIDDTQTYTLPQVPIETIIDSLITDLESCKDYAPRRISLSDNRNNTGKVTRSAMYSLLAELYLWRASDFNLTPAEQNEYYKKCIASCDYVLDYKIKQYEERDFDDYYTAVDAKFYGEYGYPLLAEEPTQGSNRNGPEAYNAIFGQGGSYETIFEILFSTPTNRVNNGGLIGQYGIVEGRESVKGDENLLKTEPKSSNSYNNSDLFPVPSDYRLLTSFAYTSDAGVSHIYKYTVDRSRAGAGTSYGSVGKEFKLPSTAGTPDFRTDQAVNWIIYRLSEIMLFRAEAEMEMAYNLSAAAPTTESNVRKASVAVDGATLGEPDDLKKDAFDLISAVYRRSNPYVATEPKYAPTMPTTIEEFRSLLMNERRREFLFEGKRYFDLVRLSRRIGNTRLFREALNLKLGDAGASVAIKMVQMDFMYLPILKKETKLNTNLKQNSCYLDEEENSKN